VRLPASRDSRLLLAGIVASLALVAYLAVAFANTHASNGPAPGAIDRTAPWVPHDSKLVPVRYGKHAYAARVTPTAPAEPGSYGALVPTLVSSPPSGSRFIVGFWLKGTKVGRVGVVVDEFRPGATSVYVVQTTVPVTPKWRYFTFRGRVRGSWLGLGMYVYRATGVGPRTWFAVRGLTAGIDG
jgi:hypothetical protein